MIVGAIQTDGPDNHYILWNRREMIAGFDACNSKRYGVKYQTG